MLDHEPALSLEDTQPRTFVAPDALLDEPRGCGNPWLLGLIAVLVLGMMVTTIALAGFAGYRDGGLARQTQHAAARAATLNRQATLGWQDLSEGRYELAFNRCDYVRTLQPLYPEMLFCVGTAQAALNASPTPSVTPTPLPPTATETPVPAATPDAASTDSSPYSREEMFARGQEAMRRVEYESAITWLEALRSLDESFRRAEVERTLLTAYQALGAQYRSEARYGEMIIVIRKALRLGRLDDPTWEFTIYAAELYMSARSYLEAGNAAQAADTFRTLMAHAPTFSTDTQALACQAFRLAGDTASIATYRCE